VEKLISPKNELSNTFSYIPQLNNSRIRAASNHIEIDSQRHNYYSSREESYDKSQSQIYESLVEKV